MAMTVYKIYSTRNTLLYVGCTKNLGRRLSEHWWEKKNGFGGKWWFRKTLRVISETYDSPEKAKNAERMAIECEHPKHNKQHWKPKNKMDLIEYFI